MFLIDDFRALGLGANVATLAIVVVSVLTYYVCWRWSESARFRRMVKTGRTDSPSCALPSPIPVLPRWIALLGGHTLQMESDKVGCPLDLCSAFGSCTFCRFCSAAKKGTSIACKIDVFVEFSL